MILKLKNEDFLPMSNDFKGADGKLSQSKILLDNVWWEDVVREECTDLN